MKVVEILEAQPVFIHDSGKAETLDDYGRKLIKRRKAAAKRLRRKTDKNRNNYES